MRPVLLLSVTLPLLLGGCGKSEFEELTELAEQGDADAQSKLGWAYTHGKGVAEDDAEAAKWFRKAADQGYAQAQTNLGVMYAEGDGVAKDRAEAIKWWRKAAEQGDALAQFYLGVMYDNE